MSRRRLYGQGRPSTTIRVDLEVKQALAKLAEPLEDTPNTVLRRLLALDPPKGEK